MNRDLESERARDESALGCYPSVLPPNSGRVRAGELANAVKACSRLQKSQAG